ncbi:MAG: hypothetical protein WDN49_08800 [Acetobacteraceae bacterium]
MLATVSLRWSKNSRTLMRAISSAWISSPALPSTIAEKMPAIAGRGIESWSRQGVVCNRQVK